MVRAEKLVAITPLQTEDRASNVNLRDLCVRMACCWRAAGMLLRVAF